MNVVIIGAGRRGLRLARHLIEEKSSVTFLDSSMERCNLAVARLDCLAICGSATNLEKLIEAGVREADAVIALTDSDEVNLVSCGIVSSQFPEKILVIAAIRSLTYVNNEEKPILGIDVIVNPDQETAKRIHSVIRSGLYHDTITFPDTNYLLYTFTTDKDSPFTNKTLIDIRKNNDGNFVVIGVNRHGKTFTPSGDTVIKPGDTLALISDDEGAAENLKLKGFSPVKENNKKKIVMVGATRVTKFLLNLLKPSDRKKITLIEKDSAIATQFAELYPEVLILNASITEESIWDDEELYNNNLFISLTDNDELNIITASYAKKLGIERTISLLKTNTNYLSFAKSLDIDAPISTIEATVDTIVKHLRGTGVATMHTLFDGGLEVYEYVVQDTFKYLGKQLKDINIKGKAIIAAVKRGEKDESFVPDGFYAFGEGDTILISVSHANSSFLEDFIK